MVAVVAGAGFDLAGFQPHLVRRLPAYACPVFIRLCAALDITETFKQKKQELVREGFDPRLVRDALFFLDARSGVYRSIDADSYARIVDGSIRL
jgi:fatty-acyl-CoA synthase